MAKPSGNLKKGKAAQVMAKALAEVAALRAERERNGRAGGDRPKR